MGLFLETLIVKGCSAQEVTGYLGQYAQPLPDKCLLSEQQTGTAVLLDPEYVSYSELPGFISQKAGGAVLLLFLYDGDYWGYEGDEYGYGSEWQLTCLIENLGFPWTFDNALE